MVLAVSTGRHVPQRNPRTGMLCGNHTSFKSQLRAVHITDKVTLFHDGKQRACVRLRSCIERTKPNGRSTRLSGTRSAVHRSGIKGGSLHLIVSNRMRFWNVRGERFQEWRSRDQTRLASTVRRRRSREQMCLQRCAHHHETIFAIDVCESCGCCITSAHGGHRRFISVSARSRSSWRRHAGVESCTAALDTYRLSYTLFLSFRVSSVGLAFAAMVCALAYSHLKRSMQALCSRSMPAHFTRYPFSELSCD
jgi:hypothetical protein